MRQQGLRRCRFGFRRGRALLGNFDCRFGRVANSDPRQRRVHRPAIVARNKLAVIHVVLEEQFNLPVAHAAGELMAGIDALDQAQLIILNDFLKTEKDPEWQARLEESIAELD